MKNKNVRVDITNFVTEEMTKLREAEKPSDRLDCDCNPPINLSHEDRIRIEKAVIEIVLISCHYEAL